RSLRIDARVAQREVPDSGVRAPAVRRSAAVRAGRVGAGGPARAPKGRVSAALLAATLCAVGVAPSCSTPGTGTGPADEPAPAAAVQTFDVETVELGDRSATVRFHVRTVDGPADAWRDPLVLRASERPSAVWLDGDALARVETRGDRVRITPAAPVDGALHTLELEFPERSGADAALGAGPRSIRVGPDDAADRVTLVGPATGFAAGASARGARVVPASADLARRADPSVPEAAVAFTLWCERTLLSLFPADAAEAPARPATHWFGALVAPVDGPEGAGVAALPSVLAALWAEDEAVARGGADAALRELVEAGAHTERIDDAWAVPRHLATRRIAGADRYREALRALVLEHGGGAPVGANALGDALDAAGASEAAAHARAWLAGPGRPRVRTQWRFDGERGRVLVRVDQVHAIEGGAPAAYPFTLPIRLITTSGALEDFDLEVDARRELLEVPATLEPLALNVDPDGTLAGLVDFEPSDER
ncbi:MAG: hypothetical protein AAFP22_16620, partial [Planctomycetota bacterium]